MFVDSNDGLHHRCLVVAGIWVRYVRPRVVKKQLCLVSGRVQRMVGKSLGCLGSRVHTSMVEVCLRQALLNVQLDKVTRTLAEGRLESEKVRRWSLKRGLRGRRWKAKAST